METREGWAKRGNNFLLPLEEYGELRKETGLGTFLLSTR